MKREFAVIPTDGRLAWLLPGASAVVALAAIIYAATAQGEPRFWWLLPVVLASFGLLAFVLRRARVTLDAGTLTVVAGLLTRRVAVVDLDSAAARIVDLRERSEWQPFIKLFGTRLPGHSSGYFWMRDRRVAFALVTDRSRVLVLPEKAGARSAGKPLLLSLAQPQALLDALREDGN